MKWYERLFTCIGMYGVPLLTVVALAGILGLFSQCAHAATAADYRSYAATVEKTFNLDAGLLQGICKIESNWKPGALGRAGEIGMCQIKPSTVRMFCPSCVERTENIHQGHRSEDVRRIQKVLGMGTIDGIFGLRTHIAVTEFQKKHGLVPDGIVGPKTWRALFHTDMPSVQVTQQLLDGYKSIDYAAQYLVWLRDYLQTNDRDILAAAYNGGPANATVVYMLKVRRAYVVQP